MLKEPILSALDIKNTRGRLCLIASVQQFRRNSHYMLLMIFIFLLNQISSSSPGDIRLCINKNRLHKGWGSNQQNIPSFKKSNINYFHLNPLKYNLQELKSNKMTNIESLCSPNSINFNFYIVFPLLLNLSFFFFRFSLNICSTNYQEKRNSGLSKWL